jgi:hypothetical protein
LVVDGRAWILWKCFRYEQRKRSGETRGSSKHVAGGRMEREDGEGSGRDKKRSGETRGSSKHVAGGRMEREIREEKGETRGSSVAGGRMEREAGEIREEKRGDERK